MSMHRAWVPWLKQGRARWHQLTVMQTPQLPQLQVGSSAWYREGTREGGDGSDLPASNNFREMCGANVAALVSRGQSTRRTMRQNPETVALQVTKELREAVESDDAGLREELFAASSALNACPMLCIRKNDESCGSAAQAAAKSPRISQARWATEICAKL